MRDKFLIKLIKFIVWWKKYKNIDIYSTGYAIFKVVLGVNGASV